MSRIAIVIILLLFILGPITSYVVPASVQADSPNDQIRIYGTVVDYLARQLIPNAKITARDYETGDIVSETITSTSGFYEIDVVADREGEITVLADDPNTPGLDYVPVRRYIPSGFFTEDSFSMPFTLLPGASVRFVGVLPDMAEFLVTDQGGLLEETDSQTYWWSYFYQLFNLSDKTIVVPASVPVKVEIFWYVWLEEYTYEQYSYVVPLEGYMNLTQGSQVDVNVNEIIVPSDIKSGNSLLASVQSTISNIERIGGYVAYERMRLEVAKDLLDLASTSLSDERYDEAKADAEEAHKILKDVEGAFSNFAEDASSSALFITPLLALAAAILAAIFFEKGPKRLLVSIALYCLLFAICFFSHPGYAFLPRTMFLDLTAETLAYLASLVIPILLLSVLLLRTRKQKKLQTPTKEVSKDSPAILSAIAEAFSVASRNLKRRRLRTLLTASFLLVSVFSFVVLTTYSFESGLTVRRKGGTAPSEGILLRKHGQSKISQPGYLPLTSGGITTPPFDPIDSSFAKWLRNRNESSLVVPKVESYPCLVHDMNLSKSYIPSVVEFHEGAIQYLVESGVLGPPPPVTAVARPGQEFEFDVSGILGVYPSLEDDVTNLADIVVRGRFLGDTDLVGVLISQEAAEALRASEGDVLQILDRNFTVTGIFDSGRLNQARDLDGDPMAPQRIVVRHERSTPPPDVMPVLSFNTEYVNAEGVIILHAETAMELPLGMVVSRVVVQTERAEDMNRLARIAVLVYPFVEACVSMADGIKHLYLGTHHVVKGFAEWIVLMCFVVFNVGVLMMSAVHERKRETFIMSCLGLSPNQIASVFLAEALTIGIVAGSLGYLLGMASYRLIVFLPSSLIVKYKIETVWGILALSLSIGAAVLGTVVPARRAAITTTPSLVTEFEISVEEKPQKEGEAWTLSIPVRLNVEDLHDFFDFTETRLRSYESGVTEMIDNMERFREEGKPLANRLSFRYVYANRIYTTNSLFPSRSHEAELYTIKLMSRVKREFTTFIPLQKKSEERSIRQTATFIRRIALAYTTARRSTNQLGQHD